MDRTDYEILCALALNRIFGYKPALSRALTARFGSPGAVFDLTPKALDDAFGPFSKFRPLLNHDAIEDASQEMAMLRDEGCLFVPLGFPGYPHLLAHCVHSVQIGKKQASAHAACDYDAVLLNVQLVR